MMNLLGFFFFSYFFYFMHSKTIIGILLSLEGLLLVGLISITLGWMMEENAIWSFIFVMVIMVMGSAIGCGMVAHVTTSTGSDSLKSNNLSRG